MKKEYKTIPTDLCDSCCFSRKITGSGKEIKSCAMVDLWIEFPVDKCSSYSPLGTVPLYQLEGMAVYIEKKKDSAGFRFTKRVDGDEVDFK